MAQERHALTKEVTLAWLYLQTSLSKREKDLPQAFKLLVECLAERDDIIQVHKTSAVLTGPSPLVSVTYLELQSTQKT